MAQNEAYTVTFGDRAENEAGMQMIGTLAPNGVSVANLGQMRDQLVTDGSSPVSVEDLPREFLVCAEDLGKQQSFSRAGRPSGGREGQRIEPYKPTYAAKFQISFQKY